MLQLLSRPTSARRIGRIGLEFDAEGISCAQIRHDHSGWRLYRHRQTSFLTASALRDQGAGSPSLQSPSAYRIPGVGTVSGQDLLLLMAGMRDPQVAFALPMEVCDLKVMDLPAGSISELRQMIGGELVAAGLSDDTFDFWPVSDGSSQHRELQTVCTCLAQRESIDGLIHLGDRLGLCIDGIDSIPTAAARAVGMMPGLPQSNGMTLSLAVHIGWHQCTCVFVRDGIPLLARIPGVAGLGLLVQQCASALNRTDGDVLRIMRGIQDDLLIHIPDAMLEILVECVRIWAEPLAQEILKSIAYSRRPGLRAVPAGLVLMGRGSSVPGLREILESELNIETCIWHPSGPGNGTDMGAFAIPAALSAWEPLR
ncbi:MAG: hypothetical protein KDA85_10970 [Planctomycetaceae bacterium]|nr:hypothetical protein [Planctomycetaceae bacterium]